MILENTVAFPEICYPNSLSRLAQECQWNQHCQLSILEMVLHVTIDSSVHKYVPLRGSLFRGLFGLFYYYSRVPNKRTPPPRLLEISKKILKIGWILMKKINFIESKKALTKTECSKSMNWSFYTFSTHSYTPGKAPSQLGPRPSSYLGPPSRLFGTRE